MIASDAAAFDADTTRLGRPAGWALAVLVFALSQLLFWTGLTLLERMSQPADLRKGGSVTLLLSDATGQFGPASRRVEARYEPSPFFRYDDPLRAPKARYVATFDAPADIAADDAPPWGLFLYYSNTLGDIWLNGELVKARVDDGQWVGLFVFSPTVLVLPKSALRPGRNEIQIENVSRHARKVLAPFAIGPAEPLENAVVWGKFAAVYMPMAAVAVMAFTILLCLITYWPREDRRWIRAFMALLTAWGLFSLMSIGAFSYVMPDHPFWRNSIHWMAYYAWLFAFAGFALTWARAPAWALQSCIILYVLVVGIAMAAFSLHEVYVPETGRRASQTIWKALEHSVTISVGLAIAGLMVWSLARQAGRRALETFLFLIGIAGVTVDALDDRFLLHAPFFPDLPLTFAIAPACGVFMALGMCAALARQASEARRAVGDANVTLKARLGEQEAALQDAHRKERALARNQALLEERQRIVADMHDGFGGQLAALAADLKTGRAGQAAVERALDDALDDLRVTVVSLDKAGAPLDEALAAFRDRVRSSLEASGLEFGWVNRLDGPCAAFGPQTNLHLFRLLQEALSNAARHSGSPLVELRVERVWTPDPTLRISVVDQGKGFDPEAAAGRGLEAMRARAARCGGRLELDSGPGGTLVSLILPETAAALP